MKTIGRSISSAIFILTAQFSLHVLAGDTGKSIAIGAGAAGLAGTFTTLAPFSTTSISSSPLSEEDQQKQKILAAQPDCQEYLRAEASKQNPIMTIKMYEGIDAMKSVYTDIVKDKTDYEIIQMIALVNK